MLTMVATPLASPPDAPAVRILTATDLPARLADLEAYVARAGLVPLSRHPAWLLVLEEGLKQTPYCLEAVAARSTCGFLPLAYVHSLLFGRFLVSLPYLNYGGVVAADAATEHALIQEARALADRLGVRYLELRQERELDEPELQRQDSKVNMRLDLPGSVGKLWDGLFAKVRNQVRKAQKGELTVSWGGLELLPEYYAVFSRNMRDLGTPVYSRELFAAALRRFPGKAELCVVRTGDKAVAASFVLHGWGVTEVPSGSSLREYNHTCANMLLYWSMLEHAVERGQQVFDFGRSTPDSNTFRFKKQWGARPERSVWHYYVRTGTAADMRPTNPKYERMRRLWSRLPLRVSRLLGPWIVRGIP